jgi:hypothetical protein
MVTDLMTTLPISNPPFSSSSTILSMYISYFSSSARFCWWIFAHLIIPERGGGTDDCRDPAVLYSSDGKDITTLFLVEGWGGGLSGITHRWSSAHKVDRPTRTDPKCCEVKKRILRASYFCYCQGFFGGCLVVWTGNGGPRGENVPHTTRNI